MLLLRINYIQNLPFPSGKINENTDPKKSSILGFRGAVAKYAEKVSGEERFTVL
jgi:hypothetical protein